MTSARPRVVLSIYDDRDNPYYAGGGPIVVHRIATSLLHSYDVLVVTGGRRWRRDEREGVPYLTVPVLWAGPRAGQLLWALLLPLIAAFGSYDLWLESFTPPFSSDFLPLVSRRPVIGLAQALSGRDILVRYRTSIPLRLERRLLRAYRDVVVLNEFDAGAVTGCGPGIRVHLIRNSVEPPDRPIPAAADGGHILFLGRIDIRQKGLDLLLAAHRMAGERCLPLVLAGSGLSREEDMLRDLVDAAPAVRWVGHVTGSAKDTLLDGAAFVVVSSREESFSLTALEAMAHGRPVVHFDLPQLAWIGPDCGIGVPRFDVHALTAALVELSEDTARRARLGRSAREVAVRTEQEFSGAYRRLVDEVLAAQGSR